MYWGCLRSFFTLNRWIWIFKEYAKATKSESQILVEKSVLFCSLKLHLIFRTTLRMINAHRCAWIKSYNVGMQTAIPENDIMWTSLINSLPLSTVMAGLGSTCTRYCLRTWGLINTELKVPTLFGSKFPSYRLRAQLLNGCVPTNNYDRTNYSKYESVHRLLFSPLRLVFSVFLRAESNLKSPLPLSFLTS